MRFTVTTASRTTIFLFVLWTFIDFPIQWMAGFGWRAFTVHEQSAWLHFWLQIGRQMGLRDVPADKSSFDAFVSAYEAREMVPDAASARVADAAVAIMQGWLPAPLRGLVRPIAACLARPSIPRPADFVPPAPWLRTTVRGVLKVRARIKAWISTERYPALLADRAYRSYPKGLPPIEDAGPPRHHPLARAQLERYPTE